MGDGKTVLAIILGGFTGVDVVHISALALKRYGCTRSTFLTPPYVFTGEEHCWDFVSGDPAKDFLACGEEGFRCFLLKKEAHTIEDLKIRVWDAAIMTGMASGVLDAAMAKCKESVIAVEDKTPWQEAANAVIDANIGGMEDIYEQIQALQSYSFDPLLIRGARG